MEHRVSIVVGLSMRKYFFFERIWIGRNPQFARTTPLKAKNNYVHMLNVMKLYSRSRKLENGRSRSCFSMRNYVFFEWLCSYELRFSPDPVNGKRSKFVTFSMRTKVFLLGMILLVRFQVLTLQSLSSRERNHSKRKHYFRTHADRHETRLFCVFYGIEYIFITLPCVSKYFEWFLLVWA